MRRAFTILLIVLASIAVGVVIAPADPWSQAIHVIPMLLVSIPSYIVGAQQGRRFQENVAAVAGISPSVAETPPDLVDPSQPAVGTVQMEPLAAVGGPCRAMFRCKLPGGWLVGSLGGRGQEALAFYPDPDHKWDGNSLS